jgi:hypothetical protein
MEGRGILQEVCAREEERVGWTQEEAVGLLWDDLDVWLELTH